MTISGRALCTALLGLMLYATELHAEAPIRVAVPDISNLLTENENGVYQKILDRALSNLQVDVDERFYPYKRALLVFEQGGADCIYSFTEVLERRLGEKAVIASFPLGKFSYHLFTTKASPPPEGLASLKGRQVGAVIGHETYLDPLLAEYDIDIVWAKNDELNVAMLDHDRFDTIIAAIPDVRPYLDGLSYAPERPLLESYDRLTCHNNERNQVFLGDLSREMRRLKEQGVYEQLAGDLYVDFDSQSVGFWHSD
ncbi:type 2 periplasmic-binding domain-containing protein [Marinobacter sp. F4206]|uniref:transporter substrate-binding domain-containing protein n=1 Tax=Marinobacter sp. F4206 TaxID=2861777 RepID=UPI001C5DD48E|nr:transporter substrate-binding domain-containing protein [Marinobacter sp. F4206]MBW4934940.1 transporter substrate-binding domain-containing protein [Marinobacter sp. F4206]